jgi:serine/threonine-protein kinase RsbT
MGSRAKASCGEGRGDMSLSRHGVLTVLSRHVSLNTANGILRWLNREYHLDPDRISAVDIPRFVDALELGAKPFLTDESRSELRNALLGSSVPKPTTSEVFMVRAEGDVSRTRLAARHLCQTAGATSLICMQVATGVSELARNIVQYAGSGEIEVSFRESPNRSVVVIATDRGPGIANWETILAGHYQSKTGMGRGLLGIKRMANRFDLKTSSAGTRIEFEVKL